MSCLTLWPLPECGINGECIEENGTAICSCLNGFSQTLDFNVFVEEKDLKRSICINNADFVAGFYILLLILLSLNILFLVYESTSLNKAVRRIPAYLMSFFALIFSIYRLATPDQALTMREVGASVIFSLYISSGQYIYYAWVNKYLSYMSTKLSSGAAGMNIGTKRRGLYEKIGDKRLFFYSTVIFVLVSQSIWLSSLTPLSVSYVLIRVMFAYWTFYQVLTMLYIYIVMTEIIQDMEGLADNTSGMGTENKEFSLFIKLSIPSTKLLRKRTLILCLFHLVADAFGAISDFGLHCWTYVGPLVMLLHTLMMFSDRINRYTVRISKRETLDTNVATLSQEAVETGASHLRSNVESETFSNSI